MSASDHLSPDQFVIPHSELENTFSGLREEYVSETAAKHYERQPRYMAALERHIRRHGIVYPAEVDARGQLQEGHHRASVAYKLGLDLPAVREGSQDHSESGYRADTDAWHAKHWKLEEEPRLRNAGVR